MAKRLTAKENARLQKVVDVYNGRKHVLYSLQRHHLEYREMLDKHERERKDFLMQLESPGRPTGKEIARNWKIRRDANGEVPEREVVDPATGRPIPIDRYRPGHRYGVPRAIAEQLLTLIELGPGHLGDCKQCNKTFIQQRAGKAFCSLACKDRNRRLKPGFKEGRRTYMRNKMAGYRKDPLPDHWTARESTRQMKRAEERLPLKRRK